MRIKNVRRVCQISRLNIPLVNENIRNHVFGGKKTANSGDLREIKGSLKHMQIYNESCSNHDSAENLVLPKLLSSDLIKHTEQAALAGIGKDFLAKISVLLDAKNLPKAPSKFVLDRPGWIKYKNGEGISVDYPEEDALVFDTENLVQIGSCPGKIECFLSAILTTSGKVPIKLSALTLLKIAERSEAWR